MQCARCHTDNRAGRKFCAACGQALAFPCPHCASVNEPGDRFCGECGRALTAPPDVSTGALLPKSYTPQHLAEQILASKSALEGERKQVTVLFGAPLAHEDHAVRACYAALAMQAAMRDYAEQVRRAHGMAVRIRVGLNSGTVVVRAIGNDLHMDYSAVGQTTHLAARMEQLADPGSILLTAATLRLVEGLVRVTTLGLVPVKGLAEPVEVFELVGASALRRRLQAAAARGLTRFVGRQGEIDTLSQALARAAAGHGQVVAVLGEAGVGKSRLVYEFVHAHHTQGWLGLESASVSYGKATPYFPVIDLLKRYVHIEDRDDTRTISICARRSSNSRNSHRSSIICRKLKPSPWPWAINVGWGRSPPI